MEGLGSTSTESDSGTYFDQFIAGRLLDPQVLETLDKIDKAGCHGAGIARLEHALGNGGLCHEAKGF